MRLIRIFELANRKETELAALFNSVSKGLARTKKRSPARRNALGSLDNIGRARAALQRRRLRR